MSERDYLLAAYRTLRKARQEMGQSLRIGHPNGSRAFQVAVETG